MREVLGWEQIEPPRLDTENPFPGLEAFREEDADFFCGRDAEAHELFQLVRREVTTVIFGKSGLGKTSLVQAGLFPELRRERCLPIPVRLVFDPRTESFVSQVAVAITRSAASSGIESPPFRPNQTLWEYFHEATFWDASNQLCRPVLVFDQFEEIFTLGRGSSFLRPFLVELADLIENRIPNSVRNRLEESREEFPFPIGESKFKIVLVLREDYLPQLEDLRSEIPSLARNRLHLGAMTNAQAITAIRGPVGNLIAEGVAEKIVRLVAAVSNGRKHEVSGELPELTVEPSLLSLVCRELNDQRRQRGLTVIDENLVVGMGDSILTDFYHRSLADLKPGVRAFVEDNLLTPSGFRKAEALDEALAKPGVTRESIEILIRRRLLRSEYRLEIPHLELIHDVLRDIVLESRERRRARERKRRRMAWAALAATIALTLAGLAVRFAVLRNQAVNERDRADDAVEFVLTEVANRLSGSGHLDLLEKLLDDTIPRLAVSAGASDQAIRNWQVALNHLGDLNIAHGNPGESIDRFTQALRLAEVLANREATPFRRDDVAYSQGQLARAYAEKGEIKKAVHWLAKSLEGYQALADRTDDVRHWRKVAEAHRRFGELFQVSGAAGEALARYQNSRDIIQELLNENPRDLDLQQDLAVITERIGSTQIRANQYATARENLETALELQEALATVDPDNLESQYNCAVIHQRLGDLAWLTGDRPRALHRFERAIAILSELSALEPADHHWQISLVTNLLNCAAVLLEMTHEQELNRKEASEYLERARTTLVVLRERAPQDSRVIEESQRAESLRSRI